MNAHAFGHSQSTVYRIKYITLEWMNATVFACSNLSKHYTTEGFFMVAGMIL